MMIKDSKRGVNRHPTKCLCVKLTALFNSSLVFINAMNSSVHIKLICPLDHIPARLNIIFCCCCVLLILLVEIIHTFFAVYQQSICDTKAIYCNKQRD